MKIRKILSFVIALVLILSVIPPVSVNATETASASRTLGAINKENYFRTYMALGDTMDFQYELDGYGYDSYLYSTKLSGSETQAQLNAKGKSLIQSGAKGTFLDGGWKYSMPIHRNKTITFQADDYGVGTYLLVCVTYNKDGTKNYENMLAVAIHIVKDPVPLTGIEYYLCDKDGKNMQKIDKDDTLSIAMTNDTRYVTVRLKPENTTHRLQRMGCKLTSRDETGSLCFMDAMGNNTYSIYSQLCGGGYVYARIETGTPDETITDNGFKVNVPCESEGIFRVIKEATCTEDGSEGYVCRSYFSCGTVFSQTVIPATGHKWGDVIIKEPTTDTTGETFCLCEYCFEEKYETIPTIDTPPEKPYKIANVVSGVHVYWNSVIGARKYGVWRSETGKDGTYKWLGNPTVNHFTDTKVESGKTYYYKITVLHTPTNTHSRKSEALGITFVSTPDISGRNNTAAGVQLSWEKISGATGYAIYRKSYSGTDAWTRVATIEGADVLSWTDTSVKNSNGEVYKYTIRALYGTTLSGCRNAGRTMVRLSSQYIKSIGNADNAAVKLSWSTSSRVTGYEVRFMAGDEVFKTFTVGNYKTGTKTFNGLTAGETYTIQVRTYKKVDGVGSFYSDWSAAKTIKI